MPASSSAASRTRSPRGPCTRFPTLHTTRRRISNTKRSGRAGGLGWFLNSSEWSSPPYLHLWRAWILNALHRIVHSTSEKNSHLGRLWQKPHLTFHYIKNNPNSILCKGANTSFSNILAYVKPVTLRNSTMCTWIPFHSLLCLPRDSLHSPKSCTSKGTDDNIHEKL